MGLLDVQNDFTHGELSPRMVARSDITLYKKGAERLRNVLVIPEGGARRRFGTVFIDDLKDRTSADLSDNAFAMIPFAYSEQVNYLLVLVDDEILIYEDDAYVTKITSTGITTEMLSTIGWAQNTNLMVFTYPTIHPKQLVRGPNSSTWTLSEVEFINYPGYDFNAAAYKDSTFDIDNVTIGEGRILTQATGTFVFTEAFVGGYFIAAGPTISNPLGYAQITAINTPDEAVITILLAFDTSLQTGTGVATGNNCVVAEKAFSDLESDMSGDRGWPISVTFYQNRLFFGGSESLPQVIFGSKSLQYFDFDIGRALDDEAIIFSIGGTKIANIKFLVSDRALQIFTFSSEWSPPQASTEALTPSNFSIRQQTNRGIENVSPQVLDNATFFVKRGGKGVMAFVYDFNTGSYNSEDISIVSNHLINQPVAATTLSGSTREDSDYLFLVNEDGTLACYQTFRSQDISAWSLADTHTYDEDDNAVDSYFRDTTTLGAETVYFIVERIINGVSKYYIERADFDVYTDCTIIQDFGSPTSTITGLSKLNGSMVQIIGDGYVLTPQLVTDNEIELDQISPGTPDTVTEASVGLAYTPLIRLMPIHMTTQEGKLDYVPKRINRVMVDYFESLGVYVNDVLIPNMEFGDVFTSENLENSLVPQTGVYEIRQNSWNISPTVEITQYDPLPMTILAVGYEVNT